MKAFMIEVGRKVMRDLPVVWMLTVVVVAVMFALKAIGVIR